jgi:hypothetical protein
MQKIEFHNLVIEVTRRCNMECGHCLRGEAQDKDLDIDALIQLLNQIKHIGDITFTGGEPTLATSHIDRILSECKKREISVNNFYLATNAKKIDGYFLRVILDWWLYCDDNEISALHWSNCYYHQCFGVPEDNIKKLSAFKFAGPKHEEECFDFRSKYGSSLILDGRAVNVSCDGRDESISPVEVDNYGNGPVVEELLYMTVAGILLPGCDYSYETMDHEAVQIGSVFQDTPIIEQIGAFNERTPKGLTVATLPEKVR